MTLCFDEDRPSREGMRRAENSVTCDVVFLSLDDEIVSFWQTFCT